MIGGSLAIFYFAGSAGSQLWRPWLVWKNATPFGEKDPQFNLDISFFAFKLPFYQALIGWFISTIIIGLLAAAVVHYLYGEFVHKALAIEQQSLPESNSPFSSDSSSWLKLLPIGSTDMRSP